VLLTNDIVDNHAAFAAIEAAGTGAFDRGVVLISSLWTSQDGTLDLDRAFRIDDHRRGAQLLPENGTSQDDSLRPRFAHNWETLPSSLRLT